LNLKIDPEFVTLNPFTISLDGGNSLLKIGITLEVSEEAAYDIDPNDPQLRDAFTGYLRALKPEQIRDAAYMAQMRAQLVRRARLILGTDAVKCESMAPNIEASISELESQLKAARKIKTDLQDGVMPELETAAQRGRVTATGLLKIVEAVKTQQDAQEKALKLQSLKQKALKKNALKQKALKQEAFKQKALAQDRLSQDTSSLSLSAMMVNPQARRHLRLT